MSSDTAVIAPTSVEHDAKVVLISILWYKSQKHEWPKRRAVAHRQSWRGPEARKAAEEYLVNRGFMEIESDTTCVPSLMGMEWLQPPSIDPQAEPDRLDLPGDEDDVLETYLWIENYRTRHNRWPGPAEGRQSGVRKRLGADRYNTAIEALVDSGWMVRITIKNSADNMLNTYFVSLRWCPWLRGLDGKLYWA